MPKVKAAVSIDKKLSIQLGICKRMMKEVEFYDNDLKVNEAKTQQMRDDNRDPYDIKKQEEILQECLMMIPDSRKRLEASLMELNGIVDEYSIEAKGDEASSGDALVSEAKLLIEHGNQYIV